MDLRRLRHFLAVIDHGSFGRAAAALGLTQSGLTKSIQFLEEECGGPLFARHQKGSTVNDLGRTLLRHARKIDHDVRAAETELEAQTLDVSRTVRIGADLPLTEDVLAPVVARLIGEESGIRVYSRGAFNTIDLMPPLLSGELDVVLGAEPEQEEIDTVTFIPLRSYLQSLVVRADHPLAQKTQCDLNDLCRYPWALPSKGTLYRARLEAYMAAHGRRLPHPAVESDSIRFRFGLVSQSDMVTVATVMDLDWARMPDLRMLDVPFNWIRRIGVLTRRDEPVSDAMELVIAALRRHFADLQ